MWIFLFMIDKAGPKPNLKPLGRVITEPERKRTKIETAKQKFVDDFTVMTAIDLKKALTRDIVRPLPYRSRTEHILPIEANASANGQYCENEQRKKNGAESTENENNDIQHTQEL